MSQTSGDIRIEYGYASEGNDPERTFLVELRYTVTWGSPGTRIDPPDPDEVEFELSQIRTESDIRSENEAERRHLVNSLCESLRSTGFSVATPRFDSKGDNDVIILAKKPSGVEAAFKVQIDGGLIYKFDRYQGQSCLNDAKAVLPKLESIYNIDLTKENVSWRNPDFTSASARQLPNSDQEYKK